jgi:methyl-accepting chemotaxis protein
MKNMKTRTLYRSFVLKLIIFTTCISVGGLVPILVLYFISVAQICDAQVSAFITAVLITAVVDCLLALFWDGYLLRPFGSYAKKTDRGEAVDEGLKILVRERINSLTVLRSYGIIIQWLAGLLAVSIVVPVMAGITFDQLLYLWVSGSIAMVSAYVLYTLVTQYLLDKLVSQGIFDETAEVVSLKPKTLLGSLVPSISAALLAIVLLMEVAIIAVAIKIGHNSITDVYSSNIVKTGRQMQFHITDIYRFNKNPQAHVKHFINTMNKNSKENIAVYDISGKLIAGPLSMSDFMKKGQGKTLVKKQGQVSDFRLNGEEFIGSVWMNNKYGLVTAVTISKSVVNASSASMSLWMIILGIAGLVFAVFMAFRYVKKMISPIRQCHTVLGNVAFGDFTKEIKILSGNEIGMLASSITILIQKIREVVKDGIQISFELANSSQELSGSTLVVSQNAQSEAASIEQITSSIEEISAGMGNIFLSAEEQYGSMIELNKRMDELSGIITRMGSSIDDTVRVTGNIRNISKAGGESLDEMNRIMEEILESSKAMITAVDIINNISEQINLLSLNASIEAARAGDAGRGFAVVSDEISKLAEQTARSIKEIDTLIRKNTSDVDSGVDQIQSTTEMLQDIIKGVNFIAERMVEFSDMTRGQLQTNTLVLGQVDSSRSRAEEIKISTEEQKIATGEISKSVNSMNELTQSYASGSEEIAGTAEAIAGMSDILKHKMEFFKV